jgi:hypothetical protein
MNLPQTNLQLYCQLMCGGASPATLHSVRCAYDVARQLFGDAFRPNHKSFLSHLVGTAAALASWNEPPASVVAGMLHSAYLYGQFGDGRRGITAQRRRWMAERIGRDAEELVAEFTQTTWHVPWPLLLARINDPRPRQLLVIKLADTLDELVDGGPTYSVCKQLPFGCRDLAETRHVALQLAAKSVGDKAVGHFEEVFQVIDQVAPVESLRTSDRSFHRMVMGAEGMRRPRWIRGMIRMLDRWPKRRAA